MIVQGSRIVGLPDCQLFLKNYLSGIYLVLEEEGGDARLLLAVDKGPVDGSGTPVLGQQRCVQVKRPHGRHAPDNLGQHPEGHNHLDVRL